VAAQRSDAGAIERGLFHQDGASGPASRALFIARYSSRAIHGEPAIGELLENRKTVTHYALEGVFDD
jgi:hypothetical protein